MARARRMPRTRRPPRALLPADRKRILRELNLRCRPSSRGSVSIAALRLRAIVMLVAGAGLRISEVVRLNAVQVLDLDAPRMKLRSLAYLRPEQSKGRRTGPEQWDSSGTILISDDARAALRAYVVEARRRQWISWPPSKTEPLFISVRGNASTGKGRHRLSVRTLQDQWHKFQLSAGIESPYVFHSLRHDALTRCSEVTNGNVKVIAEFGRCDVATALHYVHLGPHSMMQLRNDLSFNA
jgi:integrase